MYMQVWEALEIQNKGYRVSPSGNSKKADIEVVTKWLSQSDCHKVTVAKWLSQSDYNRVNQARGWHKYRCKSVIDSFWF